MTTTVFDLSQIRTNSKSRESFFRNLIDTYSRAEVVNLIPDLTGYATESYVDDAVGTIDLSGYLPLSGGTLTGPLVVQGSVTVDQAVFGVASKQLYLVPAPGWDVRISSNAAGVLCDGNNTAIGWNDAKLKRASANTIGVYQADGTTLGNITAGAATVASGDISIGALGGGLSAYSGVYWGTQPTSAPFSGILSDPGTDDNLYVRGKSQLYLQAGTANVAQLTPTLFNVFQPIAAISATFSGAVNATNAQGVSFGSTSGCKIRPFTWDTTGGSGIELVTSAGAASSFACSTINATSYGFSGSTHFIGPLNKYKCVIDSGSFYGGGTPFLGLASNARLGWHDDGNVNGSNTEWFERVSSGVVALKKTGGLDADFTAAAGLFTGPVRGGGVGVGVVLENGGEAIITRNGAAIEIANGSFWSGVTISKAATFSGNVTTLGAFKPASIADASASNNSIYYSSDAGKLVYKDSSGTVNNLY